MGLATNIRNMVRSVITKYGSDATHYSFADATKTQDNEGHYTVTDWGTGTSIKVISSNHHKFRRMAERFGEESNESERVMLIRDDTITPSQKDKIAVDSDSYEISECRSTDPIQNVIIAYRLVMIEPTWSET